MTFFYIVLLKDKLLYVVLSALINYNLQARFSPPSVFEKVLLENGHNNLIIVDGCFGPAVAELRLGSGNHVARTRNIYCLLLYRKLLPIESLV